MAVRRASRLEDRRPAFTLIEIMITLAILSVLAGLLVAALGGVFRRTTSAKAVQEIDQMSQALEAFKNKHAMYPPSRIRLNEDGDYSAGGLTADSRRWLRIMWPKIKFNGDSGFAPWDVNGDGDTTDSFILGGWECLVFFLSGLPDPTNGVGAGFSKNPANPFQRDGSNNVDKPEPPYHTFPAGRLIDRYWHDGSGFAVGTNGFPECLDPFEQRPYAYFSAYGGRGYRPYDCADPGEPSRDFDNAEGSGTVTSNGPNPYTMGASDDQPATWWKADSFQIIAPGVDGRYGAGGRFNPSDDPPSLVAGRDKDADNVTNFHKAELGR